MKKIIKYLRNKLFSALATQLLYELKTRSAQVSEELHKYHSSKISAVAQKQLFHFYSNELAKGNKFDLNTTGFRNLSQFEEDGLILFILAAIGIKSRTFVDIGSANGINSNCANLAINFGFHGLFIDGDENLIQEGRSFYNAHPDTWLYPPKFECAFIKRENINELIKKNGFGGEIDLLSIDIDGNDYWIWDALEVINPRIVIIETHIELGSQSIVVPYDENFSISDKHPDYFGASAPAMVKLAESKGYRLVGTNRFGFNTIFVKGDEGLSVLPKIDLSDTIIHPRHIEKLLNPKLLEKYKFINP